MIARPPVMCFYFGAPKVEEVLSTIPFKSIHKDLRTVGAQGAVLRIPYFYFSDGPNVKGGGGPYVLKRVPHYQGSKNSKNRGPFEVSP